MKSNLPEKGLLKLLIKKFKNPFYIFIIVILYFLNDYIKIIKTTEIAVAVCIFFVCLVLLRDTIYKCLDRWCKRDETIEKEKTKRVLAKDPGKNEDDTSDNENVTSAKGTNLNTRNNDSDVKVYDIKHRKHS